MTAVGRKHGPSADRVMANCREALGVERATRRADDIASLLVVEWKGRTLYALRCHGISGKGSHIVNVPIALLWSLISLDGYLCPYHCGDAWSPAFQSRGLTP